jgi:hypothetical protein
MLVPLLGYFFCMITMLTAVTVLLTSFSGISTLKKGRPHPRPPVIGRTVTAEETAQWHSPVAKEAAPAKDVSPVVATAKADTKKSKLVATAKADTKKSKHYKPKVFARQRDNYSYGNALGYAQESGYGPRGLFFR